MDAIRNFLQNNVFDLINGYIEQYITPLINNMTDFIKNLNPSVLAAFLLLVAICLLIGLLRWIFKGFKSFLIVVIILGIFVGLAILAGGFSVAPQEVASFVLSIQ